MSTISLKLDNVNSRWNKKCVSTALLVLFLWIVCLSTLHPLWSSQSIDTSSRPSFWWNPSFKRVLSSTYSTYQNLTTVVVRTETTLSLVCQLVFSSRIDKRNLVLPNGKHLYILERERHLPSCKIETKRWHRKKETTMGLPSNELDLWATSLLMKTKNLPISTSLESQLWSGTFLKFYLCRPVRCCHGLLRFGGGEPSNLFA